MIRNGAACEHPLVENVPTLLPLAEYENGLTGESPFAVETFASFDVSGELTLLLNVREASGADSIGKMVLLLEESEVEHVTFAFLAEGITGATEASEPSQIPLINNMRSLSVLLYC